MLLLVVTLGNAKYHVYQELGQELSTNDPLYQEESKQFVGLVVTWMCFCGFEYLMMLLGTSIPHMFAQWVLIQVLLHLLGCVFLVWFILDSWAASFIVRLFIGYSVLPLIAEFVIIGHAFKFNYDLGRNNPTQQA